MTRTHIKIEWPENGPELTTEGHEKALQQVEAMGFEYYGTTATDLMDLAFASGRDVWMDDAGNVWIGFIESNMYGATYELVMVEDADEALYYMEAAR